VIGRRFALPVPHNVRIEGGFVYGCSQSNRASRSIMASTNGKSRFDVTINPFVVNNRRASQMRKYASKIFRKSYPYFGTVTFPGPIPNPHGFSCEAEAWESPVKRDEYNLSGTKNCHFNLFNSLVFTLKISRKWFDHPTTGKVLNTFGGLFFPPNKRTHDHGWRRKARPIR
jgi:hypothetical protein